ncbi:MAG TPA: zinc-dependent metalloprotease family protein, partial [Geobacteraceae bacterium]
AVVGTVNTPGTCTPNGLAITGGALVVACNGSSTVLRFDKNTGAALSPNGTLSVGAGVLPALGDLACDPVTFSGQFKDALWSRNGVNGNGVVALQFPPFTCGLPSNATVFWAGLSAPSGGIPGAALNPACFDALGNVKDLDGDGLPDCWEDGSLWADGKPGIDFDGDGVRDLVLCVMVNTNGDGVTLTLECATKDHKDLFVEIDWMQDHKPDPLALSQPLNVTSVQSVREAFRTAPVGGNPDGTTGIRFHLQVDEQISFTTFAGTAATHVTELVFTPCTVPATNPDGTLNVKSLSDSADFDVIKKANFGTAAERASGANTLNAKRLAFRYMLFGHNLTGTNQGGSTGSGCSEVAGDDATVTLGSFAQTTVNGVTHNRGLTDQQAGTFMHEFGHNLGLDHGGHEKFNCKPNYLSVMSYSRQFAGSPIPNRRLDYSSAQLLTLNEAGGLNELIALGGDVSLGPEPPFFPSADQTAFGPSAWSVVTANQAPINWDRSKQGPNPTYQSATSADLNNGPGGCDGSGTVLEGHNDWNSLLYRASAALDFAGGVHTTTSKEHVSITSEQEQKLFLAADLDANGVADAQDCDTFLCTHRIDIKPSYPVPKQISQGLDSTVSVAIFSEKSGNLVWNAPAQVQQNATLKLNGISVKVNQNGQGTCSASDVADP